VPVDPNIPQLPAIVGNELALLPSVYVGRQYAAAGAPSWPLAELDFDSARYARAAAIFATAAVSGQGVSIDARTFGTYALGLALATVALVTDRRLPAVPAQWTEVHEAQRVGGPAAQVPGTRARIIVSPWGCATPANADEHRRKVLKLARKSLAAIAHARIVATTQTIGTSYLSDVSGPIPDVPITVPPIEGGPILVALPALAGGILLTVAVVGAIGISQWFKADVEKTRLYLENSTAVPLAGISAALALELDRQKKEAETKTKIEPSTLAVKIADATAKRVETLPEGPGQTLRIVGGVVGGVVLAIGGAYLYNRLSGRHGREAYG